MAQPTGALAVGLAFEELRRYPFLVALVSENFKRVAGKRLVYRPLSDAAETHRIGIARAAKGDVTPAGEKFCEALRTVLRVSRAKKTQR